MTDETTTPEDTTPEVETPVAPAEETAAPEEPKPVTVHSAYVVVINEDGTLSTTLVKPGNAVFFDVVKATTTYDVFTTSKELANEIESQVMADRISKAVIARLTPADPDAEAKARIAQALADRQAE
jgi:hypothetical protein